MSQQPVPVCYRHPDRETYISCQRCNRPICPDCMRPAAVGFQCPECVAEGARQTRQGAAPYGGQRSANPHLTSLVLIGINVAVWLAVVATGYTKSRLLDYLMLRAEGACVNGQLWYPSATERICPALGGSWTPGVSDGAWWQLITSAFTHVEVWHIGFNMLALWFLGPQLEMVIGRARFLALYLISALGGSTLVYLLASPQTPTLGASGAVFGLMAGLLVFAYKVGAQMQSVLGWVAANFVITFIVPGISWQGHVGGFVTGAVVAAVIAYAPRARRAQVQWTGLIGVVVILAVLIAMRTAALA